MLKPGIGADFFKVAPARERGLKCNHSIPRPANLSRSREGAWIEILKGWNGSEWSVVAPARERGLKFF